MLIQGKSAYQGTTGESIHDIEIQLHQLGVMLDRQMLEQHQVQHPFRRICGQENAICRS
jgi:hypothetical protein